MAAVVTDEGFPVKNAAAGVSPDVLWSSISSICRQRLGLSTFRVWIEPVRPLTVDGRTLLLSVPERSLPWTVKRFGELIKRLASELAGGIEVDFVPYGRAHSGRRGEGRTREQESKRPPGSLNFHYTFDQFIIGESNHLAHAAALIVAELPAQTYNPLVIYGPTGVGKTHLLQAIANHTTLYTPNLNTVFTTVEGFTNEFVYALRKGRTPAFKERYRNVDLLLIDDIQFLQGKEQTQEEFFHTFNALRQIGAQLVLTSDRRPCDLTLLHERLQSRFTLGLTVDIAEPDYDTRLAFINKRVQREKLPVGDRAFIETLAQSVKGSIRNLEGALVRTVAYASLSGKPLTPELVGHVINSLYGTNKSTQATPEKIIAAICEQFSVSISDLKSNGRRRDLALPRHLAMYLVREMTQLSLPQTARLFNRSDHTTVLNAVRRADEVIHRDEDIKAKLALIKSRLTS